MVVWIIIIGFYAPLHFLLPVLVLFITGNESEQLRKRLIRQALIDSALSLLVAFVLAILLVNLELMLLAMLVLLVSMLVPFIRIFLHRRMLQAANNQSMPQ
jgi:hypothetical protein